MKKYIIIIAISAAVLTGCTTSKLANATDDIRGQISWTAFCQAHGHDPHDTTYPTVNQYLDTWCGSAEEENALIKAGIKPY